MAFVVFQWAKWRLISTSFCLLIFCYLRVYAEIWFWDIFDDYTVAQTPLSLCRLQCPRSSTHTDIQSEEVWLICHFYDVLRYNLILFLKLSHVSVWAYFGVPFLFWFSFHWCFIFCFGSLCEWMNWNIILCLHLRTTLHGELILIF